MNDYDEKCLRIERISLLIVTMIGQISNLLNSIQRKTLTMEQIYSDLFDIHNMAGLQIHEIYYKLNNLEGNLKNE